MFQSIQNLVQFPDWFIFEMVVYTLFAGDRIIQNLSLIRMENEEENVLRMNVIFMRNTKCNQ